MRSFRFFLIFFILILYYIIRNEAAFFQSRDFTIPEIIKTFILETGCVH